MRYITTAIFAITTLGAAAQDSITTTELPKQRKNEIGLISDLGFSNTATGGNGIQYKRWVKPDFQAIRVQMGHLQYTNVDNKIYFPAQGDTIFSKRAYTQIPSVYAGVGIEMQRHFYKRVYMYAAIDLYGAYGRGTSKDLFEKEVTQNGETEQVSYMESPTYNSSLFKVGLLPMVGVKLQFSRISFGTELSGIKMEYSSLTHSNGKPSQGGITDFSLGEFSQRVFLNYRF